MRLLRGLHNPGIGSEGCVATIGNFDGVHLGHQSVLKQLRKQALKLNKPSVVIIFEPQPLEFLSPDDAPARLMCLREKLEALQSCGVDAVFCLKFDETLRTQSAARFVERILVEHLNIKHLVIGDDFRFGGDREGDFLLLKRSGEELGFSVENTPTKTSSKDESGIRISSTQVREMLAIGDFERAQRLLGKPFSVSGRVLHGEKIGRGIGFPTANLALKRLHSPLLGVFAVRVHRRDGRIQDGVANIGTKPTIGQFQPNLEVHVFNENESFYGERIQVEFVAKIRGEKRFDGLEQLKKQITNDIAKAKERLAH